MKQKNCIFIFHIFLYFEIIFLMSIIYTNIVNKLIKSDGIQTDYQELMNDKVNFNIQY